jgi:hypothetical protein
MVLLIFGMDILGKELVLDFKVLKVLKELRVLKDCRD